MATYAQKLSNVISSCCVGFAASLAKDAGVLRTLINAQTALTAQEIADSAGLKERYVREILDCLVTAELLHASKTEAGFLVYHLEDDEKKVFDSAIMPNISVPGVLSSVYEQVKGCLPKSGPYGVRYQEPHYRLIDECSMYKLDVEKLLTLVDGLKDKLESGIQVLEFGCGSGRLLAKFASMFPKSSFTASEVVPELMTQLRTRWGHIPNIKYELHDLCSLPDSPPKKYDWIFCVDVIHDLPKPLEALKGVRKFVNESEGIFTFIDTATSGSPMEDRGNLQIAAFYAMGTFLCLPESFQREDSDAMGPCWGKQTAINMATVAGYSVTATDMDDDRALYLCHPSCK